MELDPELCNTVIDFEKTYKTMTKEQIVKKFDELRQNIKLLHTVYYLCLDDKHLKKLQDGACRSGDNQILVWFALYIKNADMDVLAKAIRKTKDKFYIEAINAIIKEREKHFGL